MKASNCEVLLSVAAMTAALYAAPAAAQIAPTIVPAVKPSVPYAVADAEVRAKRQKLTLSKVILVGDSTTQVNSGWGGAFCATHVAHTLTCVNMGRGGRSTHSYRSEGAWDYALAEAKTPGYQGVYILIQFGHNDGPNKPGNSTDLETEFPDNLRRYVAEARAAGAVPVLVTPLTRRRFIAGSLQDDLQPWAEVVRSVARETGAPLLDLHASSVTAVQALGPVDSLELSSVEAKPEVVAAAKTGTSMTGPIFDLTHLGPKGAEFFAKQVAAGLATAVPALEKQLVR